MRERVNLVCRYRSVSRFSVESLGLVLVIAVLWMPAIGYSGERVTNGNFSAGAASWSNWTDRGSATRDFASTNFPKGGASPCLEIKNNSDFNGGVWQQISVVPSNTYTLSYAFREFGGTSWFAEILVGTVQPT